GGLSIPGFADGLPAGALVRSVPAGSFEQVTMRLGVLHALGAAGVPVCNDARAIERCVDKSTTSFLLHRAGIPTPPTWTAESIERARTLIRAEARPGRPLVLKPLFGAQGRGLLLIEDADALPPPEAVGGVYYLQHFVAGADPGWRDWRAFVLEVNSMPAWKALQGVSTVDIAQALIDEFLARLRPDFARAGAA
ncbi:MAG TPA: RimK family alpha-L-glutamate ligase, partial [Dongiaceae bacterium]|nr:RimK family alpha-L-glutamate ligase [Dongiaceae bacterium]